MIRNGKSYISGSLRGKNLKHRGFKKHLKNQLNLDSNLFFKWTLLSEKM